MRNPHNIHMISSKVIYNLIDGPFPAREDYSKSFICERVYEYVNAYDRADGTTGTTTSRSIMNLNIFFLNDGTIEVWKETDETTKLPSRKIREEAIEWAKSNLK